MSKVDENKKLEKVLLEEEKTEKIIVIKAYKRRWIILSIFMVYACINSFQWIEYSSITHIVVKYYNVSTLAVDWTSIIYMALYPVFSIPASFIIVKKGLRTAGLIGCLGTLIGTGIKVFSAKRNLFGIVLLGNGIVSTSQILILCLPPKIAAVWFKPNEVSTACSLGVFGTLFGCAIGYILPPLIVQDSDNFDDIGNGLKTLSWILTCAIIPAALAVVLYFPNEPPLPPSKSQAVLRNNKEKFGSKDFLKSIKTLLGNKPFLIHMVAYGINFSSFSAIGTLLNQFVLQYFKGANEEAGRMGFITIVAGMISSILFGLLLDKTHKYKEITLAIYFSCTVSIVMLIYTLEWRSMFWTYIACGIVGAFTNGYMPVGFELAMELTYPSEESTTTTILMTLTQIIGVFLTVALGHLNQSVGAYWSLVSQVLLLFVGTIITATIPNKLLRQEAFNLNNNFKKISHS